MIRRPPISTPTDPIFPSTTLFRADDRHLWTVQLDDGTVDECHVLVSGVGFLNVPSYPNWPGLGDFSGPQFHTARWERSEEHTSELQSLMRSSYAGFCLKKKTTWYDN